MSEVKNSNFYIKLPFLLAIAICAGILIGATMSDGTSGKSPRKVNNAQKFKEILSYIERDYVDEVDTDELVETAITKMLEKLDPHSVYISADDKQLANSQLESEFDGIGVEFSIIRDTINVVAPLTGGPSEEQGIRSGDKIVKVDGELVAGTGITNREVFGKLRGPKGSEVALTIKRPLEDEVIDFKIIRNKIPQTSIDVAYMVDEEVGYIKVSNFRASTYEEFKEALQQLKSDGMQKLILDLQGNPGGYMGASIKMADEFLSDNQMIVYTEGKSKQYDTEAKAYRSGIFESGALIVLINEGSASASEIVAGALQDNDRGLIVGRRSFGKGLVQLPLNISDGSEIRLTISRYFTPSGRSIQKPYDNEDNAYRSDITNRYDHGEFFSADSIKFDDSLRYHTNKGRTVYGGGGIMPDFFVPYDTAAYTKYLTKLNNNNILREYTMNYANQNKAKLEKMDFATYKKSFVISDDMLQQVIKMGERSGVSFRESEFERSKTFLKIQVKALIAKSIWKNEGFYPIYNESDEIFQMALQLFEEAEQLAKL